jgi:hypothetical protein
MIDFFYQYGLFGLFLAAFLSGSVFPFNSESVLSLLIYSGFDITSTLAAATAGNTLGGISIYYLGYLGKMEWIEKYAKVKPEKIHAILPKLRRYGAVAASLSFVPIFGDVVIHDDRQNCALSGRNRPYENGDVTKPSDNLLNLNSNQVYESGYSARIGSFSDD